MAGRAGGRPALLLQRRSSLVPVALYVTAAGGGDEELLELHQWKSGYTSLSDVMAATPEAACSPEAVGSGDVRIRNRLVRLAAEAYLRPVGKWAQPPADGRLRRALLALRLESLDSCFAFVGRLLGAFRAGSERRCALWWLAARERA